MPKVTKFLLRGLHELYKCFKDNHEVSRVMNILEGPQSVKMKTIPTV